MQTQNAINDKFTPPKTSTPNQYKYCRVPGCGKTTGCMHGECTKCTKNGECYLQNTDHRVKRSPSNEILNCCVS